MIPAALPHCIRASSVYDIHALTERVAAAATCVNTFFFGAELFGGFEKEFFYPEFFVPAADHHGSW